MINLSGIDQGSAVGATSSVVILATLLVALAFTLIGSVVPGRAMRPAGTDAMIGFALSTGILAVTAGLFWLPVHSCMAALGALAIVGAGLCCKRGIVPGGASLWLSLSLLIPLLVIAGSAQATRWDDFWHWLPSAAYLYRYDSLFHLGLPPALSKFPGYPQSMPFAVVAASWVGGRFLENAGAIINIFMMAAFAGVLSDVAAKYHPANGRRWVRVLRVGLMTAVVTIFYPGMNYGILLSSYADTATMVFLAVLGLLGGLTLQHRQEGREHSAAATATGFGIVAAGLVNLKQANIILFGLLCLGFLITILWERHLRIADIKRFFPRMFLPALVIFIAWRIYIAYNIPQGEMSFRSIGRWNWGAAPDMLNALKMEIFNRNPLFSALIWTISIVGIIRYWRCIPTLGSRLMLVTGVVWIGYNIFLVLVYLGAMTPDEAAHAADYWRYTPHVGLLAITAVCLSVLEMRLPFWVSPIAILCGALCTIAVPVVLMADIGIDPSRNTWAMTYRNIGRSVSDILPAGSRVMIVANKWLDPYLVGIHYDLMRPGRDNLQLSGIDSSAERLLRKNTVPFKTRKATHLLLTGRMDHLDELTTAFGLPPVKEEAILYVWTGNGFRKAAAWPAPEYIDFTRSWPISMK